MMKEEFNEIPKKIMEEIENKELYQNIFEQIKTGVNEVKEKIDEESKFKTKR
jgi:hypothetical protein